MRQFVVLWALCFALAWPVLGDRLVHTAPSDRFGTQWVVRFGPSVLTIFGLCVWWVIM